MQGRCNLVLISGTLHPSMTAELILLFHVWFSLFLGLGCHFSVTWQFFFSRSYFPWGSLIPFFSPGSVTCLCTTQAGGMPSPSWRLAWSACVTCTCTNCATCGSSSSTSPWEPSPPCRSGCGSPRESPLITTSDSPGTLRPSLVPLATLRNVKLFSKRRSCLNGAFIFFFFF